MGNSANRDSIRQAMGEPGQAPVPTPTLETNKKCWTLGRKFLADLDKKLLCPINQFKPVQQRAYCTDIYTAVSLLYFCSKIQLVLKSESAAYKILGTLLAKFLAGVAKKSQPCMWYILKDRRCLKVRKLKDIIFFDF